MRCPARRPGSRRRSSTRTSRSVRDSRGAKQLLPRWKRCLRATDGEMGEALGQAYVAKTFPPEAKAKATQVIHDVRAAFKERLMHLTWMSDSTRAHALDKLAKMREKIGYPDKWRDYSKLQVSDQPFVLNVMRSRPLRVEPGRQPARHSRWTPPNGTSPCRRSTRTTIPTKNEMVFPAGALVPADLRPQCRRRCQLRIAGRAVGRGTS